MNNFRQEMNRMGAANRPFFFITDFEMARPLLFPLDKLPGDIYFSTPVHRKTPEEQEISPSLQMKIHPVEFDVYKRSFNNVTGNIEHGNSYLLNLTFPTEIDINLTLKEIFLLSQAKYKLLYRDEFVVFSPEIFVRIDNGVIRSYPMKGTIDASLPGAEDIIMHDEKELAEHNTIIDLIRNDLSIISNNVEVTRYRYIDLIRTNGKDLLQVSSEITGELTGNWMETIGDIIVSMLPAGSISGAPKKETVRIIRESEICERGYYTGVFGLFDGERVESAVMIRFIEQSGGKYVYKSGGGITWLSDVRKEYDELISKVYVPVG